MLTSPVLTTLTTGILTATTLSLSVLIPSTASAATQPISSEPNWATSTRSNLTSPQMGGFRQPGWLIADDDDDDDDKKRGRRYYKQGDNDDDDDDDREERRYTKVTLQRAKNLARQAAEQANGGLRRYRAEASMHGPASLAPCIDNGDSWTFTFLGGAPGWQTATVESVVTVYKATSVVRVDYNGAVRTVRQNNQWKSNLKLARLINRNALVMYLDVLDKPVTNSAGVFYQVFARRNNRWLPVYRSTVTQLVSTAGRANLQPFVIPLNQLQLGNVDWSSLELKAIAYANVGSQQVVLREVEQRFQSITQITTIQELNTLPITVRNNEDDDDGDDDDD